MSVKYLWSYFVLWLHICLRHISVLDPVDQDWASWSPSTLAFSGYLRPVVLEAGGGCPVLNPLISPESSSRRSLCAFHSWVHLTAWNRTAFPSVGICILGHWGQSWLSPAVLAACQERKGHSQDFNLGSIFKWWNRLFEEKHSCQKSFFSTEGKEWLVESQGLSRYF